MKLMKQMKYLFILFVLDFIYIHGEGSEYMKCGRNKKIDAETRFIFRDENTKNSPGTWPWLVSVGGLKGGNVWEHRCGGSLVTRRHVITAAHCARDLAAQIGLGQIYIRAGDSHLQNDTDDAGVEIVQVDSFTVHPNYKRTSRYADIGVLDLTNAIELSDVIRTICLPKTATLRDQENNFHLEVTGWGADMYDEVGKVLYDTGIQVYPELYCNLTHLGAYRYQQAVPNGFSSDLFCAGDPGGREGVCHGDSGSPAIFFQPLQKSFVLKGVVSGGLSCGTYKHPNIYVRLTDETILRWIRLQISEIQTTATSKPAIPDRSCPGLDTCETKETCPYIRNKYKEHRQAATTEKKKKIVSSLKSLVCNKRRKAFCCPPPGSKALSNVADDKASWNTTSPPRCGVGRITGGASSSPGDWPWMAALMYKRLNLPSSELKSKCGGSLISRRAILTAAHCTKEDNYKLEAVRLGENDLTNLFDCKDPETLCHCPNGCEYRNGVKCLSGGGCAPPYHEYKIDKVMVHPGFKQVGTLLIKNFALVFLEKDVILTDYIKPACLPYEQFQKDQVVIRIVTGWGDTNEGVGPFTPANILKKMPVSNVPLEECGKIWFQDITQFSSELICARAKGKEIGQSVCIGDSGGPLVYTTDGISWVQYGVVSFGSPTCGDSRPTFYAELNKDIVQWITGHVGIENMPLTPET